MSDKLGSDVDGAWWPFTRSLGRELPALVEALRPAIGEVVDIQLNWLADSRTPVLSTLSPAAATRMGWNPAQQRLMSLTGRTAITTILVVPAMTSEPLALMLLRQAAGKSVPEIERRAAVFEASERILQSARVAIAAQRASARSLPIKPIG